MKSMLVAALVVCAVALGFSGPANAVVAGGGGKKSDCYAVFDGVNATKKNKVVCTDGDPTCDHDRECQGSCQFDVQACFYQQGAKCTPKTVTSIKKNTLNLDIPPTPISVATCGDETSVVVPIKKKKGRKRGRLITQVDGRPKKDKDTVILECRKRQGDCPPQLPTTTTTMPPVCGNGVVEPPTEQCDGTPTASCPANTTGTVLCATNCMHDFSDCMCNVSGCPISQPGKYTVTQVSGGSLTVDGLPAFPFPSGGAIQQDVGCPDPATCIHDVVVPFPGGFTAPVFCVPALLFTVEVRQTGCGVGKIDSDGGSDYTVEELGDTSDSSTVCNLPHAGPCTNGADSNVRVDVTVGDGTADTCASGTGNALVSIPVFTTTWQDVAFQCPDADGTYDGGTDNLIVSFPQTLDFTTDTNHATWTDLDGDGCSRAGAGPGGAGLTSSGTCLDLAAMTITTAASGPIGSAGAPLFDLTFTTLLPNTLSGPAPFDFDTCSTPPTTPASGSMATRCVQ